MAIAITTKAEIPVHNHKIVIGSVAFDDSYPTGGEAIAASDLDMQGILFIVPGGVDDATYHAAWDQTNLKMLLYVEDGTSGIEAQAANTSDQSAVNVPFLAVGY